MPETLVAEGGAAVTTITTAVAGLQADLLAIGAIGLGIGVALFALRKGYSVVRSFIK